MPDQTPKQLIEQAQDRLAARITRATDLGPCLLASTIVDVGAAIIAQLEQLRPPRPTLEQAIAYAGRREDDPRTMAAVAFLDSVRLQLEEADEQCDQIRRVAADPTSVEVIAHIANARALYAARATEDLVGALAQALGVRLEPIDVVKQRFAENATADLKNNVQVLAELDERDNSVCEGRR